jgi:hypothetical protein
MCPNSVLDDENYSIIEERVDHFVIYSRVLINDIVLVIDIYL